MPRTKVNKAAKIRETFTTLGAETRPKDVIAHLAKAKIKVSSAQVSNVKATMNGHGANGHKGPSMDDLLATKKLIDSVGSIRRVKSAVEFPGEAQIAPSGSINDLGVTSLRLSLADQFHRETGQQMPAAKKGGTVSP